MTGAARAFAIGCYALIAATTVAMEAQAGRSMTRIVTARKRTLIRNFFGVIRRRLFSSRIHVLLLRNVCGRISSQIFEM